jgi:hypothetical protein
VLEPVSDFLRPHVPLDHLVALALIKIRQLIDVGSMIARGQSHALPRFVSSIIADNHAMLSNGHLNPQSAHDLLKGQVMGMYVGECFANEHFWPALLSPGENLTVRPNACAKGSKQGDADHVAAEL